MNINPRMDDEHPAHDTPRMVAWGSGRRRAGVAVLVASILGIALVYLFVAYQSEPSQTGSVPVFVGAQPQAANEGAPTAATPGEVRLTAEQRAAAGIEVEPITLRSHAEIFPAPGEVRVNEYATSNVTSRLRATVISRLAKLGDRVQTGQVLVTLYSAEMAEAESAFVLASKTYVRMNNLKGYISGQQFDEAEVKRDEARGRLETYGLSDAQIAELASNGLATRPAGQFQLSAPQAGLITSEDFRLGEVVEPGKTLFEVSNLSSVWVEAQVSPEIAPRISGDRARIVAAGKTYEARIIQTLAQLNETTRTVGIRLQVANSAGTLRPGEYTAVELFSRAVPELFLPTEAVLREADGGWVVYVENAGGAFAPVRVQPLHAAEDETAISGIAEGTRVVTRGAFFVKSEADKASFGEEE